MLKMSDIPQVGNGCKSITRASVRLELLHKLVDRLLGSYHVLDRPYKATRAIRKVDERP